MRQAVRLSRSTLFEVGAVLTAVKDAARRASTRWPSAILDRGCARHLEDDQAGTRKRPPAEQGNMPMVAGASLLRVVAAVGKKRPNSHLWRRGGINRDVGLHLKATPDIPAGW